MIVDTTQFQFGVHQKQLGCGPQKEEDPDGWIVNYLKDYSTDVLGYEMEAEGFYRALEEQKVEALFIKGVADFGDFSDHQGLSAEERSKEKKKSQSQAVCNALDVALKWVEHFIQFPRS
jgi:purine-nucleoside phosphorylase